MKTIRENLITLRDFIANVPVKEIDLNSTHSETTCGTTYCVFGWAAASNLFKGLQWEPDKCAVTYLGQRVYYGYYSHLDGLFGDHCHAVLFQFAGDGSLDAALGFPEKWDRNNTYSQEDQKALALARIDAQLRSYP